MADCAIHVLLAPEIEAIVADNGIDLVKELRKQGLEVEKSFSVDPSARDRDRSKDVVLTILASSTAALALSAGISKIFDALGRNKKVIAKEMVCEPIVGEDGKAMKFPDGSPMLQWIERTRMIEAQQTTQDATKLSTSFSLKRGIKIELNTGET